MVPLLSYIALLSIPLMGNTALILRLCMAILQLFLRSYAFVSRYCAFLLCYNANAFVVLYNVFLNLHFKIRLWFALVCLYLALFLNNHNIGFRGNV
jgi:hypothetical protein